MNKELEFAKILEQVKKQAREQGNFVREEQVQEAFATLELGEEQLQMVYDYLLKHKIGIGAPLKMEDYLSDTEIDYLQNYLDEIRELPSYTDGQVQAFTMSAMAGDGEAQSRLVEHYLKDVTEIAKLYAGQGVFLEDLIGEGNVALAMGVTMLGSLEEPSEAQGMLARMMMDAMEEYIAEHVSNEKKERKLEEKVNLVADSAREMAEALQRKVAVPELAEETGMSEKAIRDALRMSGFRIEDIEG